MPKVQQSGNRFHITIPNEYIRLLGWEKGTELAFIGTGEGELKLKQLPKLTEQKK